ncbi:hypothetical protein TSAR_015736 [Trichomalopsis sarcophagae]|uniref:Cytoplasmic tRNA 2-thiolation protein 1 n=1 Tax=Trichomalopsis sarcophagae TaxID=543379 RepID=A0A232EN72_9HYME|nr:hypothetical protein TSAR_015736 [Trichomalopsis sarcophagae]
MPIVCNRVTCNKNAVLKRPKTGDPMCKECFFDCFETEIHVTIVKAELFKRGDKVAIGASGGKDSTVLAYILKLLNERYDYGLELFLLSIDEGISGYRDDSLETVKQNRDDYQLPLKILSYKDLYGWSMDEIVKQIGKKNNCTFCGVFRRQALDRGAALLNADMIVTGHNADDIAETVIMNVLRGDLARLSRCTHIITEGEGTIPRCKPLKYAYEKEIVMYAHYKELVYFSTECSYSPEAYRGHTREFLKQIERVRPTAILDIIHSGEMVRLKRSVKIPERRNCTRCGFIASQEICKACVLLEGLNIGMPKLGIGKSNKAKKILGMKVEDGSENIEKNARKKPPRIGDSKKKIRREMKKKKMEQDNLIRRGLIKPEEEKEQSSSCGGGGDCGDSCGSKKPEASSEVADDFLFLLPDADPFEQSSSCGGGEKKGNCGSGCRSKDSNQSTSGISEAAALERKMEDISLDSPSEESPYYEELGCGGVIDYALRVGASGDDDEEFVMEAEEMEEEIECECPSELRADPDETRNKTSSPPLELNFDPDEDGDEEFNIPVFKKLMAMMHPELRVHLKEPLTPEEIEAAENKESYRFSDEDIDFLASMIVKDLKPIESDEESDKQDKHSTEPQPTTQADTNKTKVTKEALEEPQSTGDGPTLVKAKPKRVGPTLLLPEMMYKAKNNLDF